MRRNTGFTLLELLVVVTLIIVLASLILPSINEWRKESKNTTCMSNLKAIVKSVIGYAVEDNEHIVPMNQVSWERDDPNTDYRWYTNVLSKYDTTLRAEWDDARIGDVKCSGSGRWSCPSVSEEETRKDLGAWGAGYGLNEWRYHRYPCRNQYFGGSPSRLDRIPRPAEGFSIADARMESRVLSWVAAFGIHPPCMWMLACWDQGGQQIAPRHGRGAANAAFLDGHVGSLTAKGCTGDGHAWLFGTEADPNGFCCFCGR